MKLEVAEVISSMGLRLSAEKTRITHLDEGFNFLGWRIQRHYKKGTNRRYVYTYPAKKALSSIKGKVKDICRSMDLSQPLDPLLRRLNPALRGMVSVLPTRGLQRNIQLSERLRVEAGTQMAVSETLRSQMEGLSPALLRGRHMADLGKERTIRPWKGTHHTVPIPGRSDPKPVESHHMRNL